MKKYAIFVNGKLIKTFKSFKSAASVFQRSVDFLKQSNQNNEISIQVVGLGEGILLEN